MLFSKRLINWSFLVSVLLMSVSPVAAQEPTEESYPVEVGAYIIDIYDLSFVDNEVKVEFYIWFVFEKQEGLSIDPLSDFFIVNAKEMEKDEQITTEDGNRVYQISRITATIKKKWDVIDYPFDEHTIEIFIEDGSDQWQVIAYQPDQPNSKIDPDIILDGWAIQPLEVELTEKVWVSNFGDPTISNQTSTDFNRVSINIGIDRPNGGIVMFIKVFMGALVSVIVAFLSLLVRPEELEVRTGLTVGSLFAAIGSQLVVSGLLPETAKPIFVDNFHIVAFVFIGITALMAVITNNLYSTEREKLAKSINWWALRVLPIAYAVVVVAMAIIYFRLGASG